MSRIGKKIIPLPKGVKVSVVGQHVTVQGPKGTLARDIHESMGLVIEDQQMHVEPKALTNDMKKFFGLTRSLLNNMVVGVSEGFTKGLTLVGVGYRAALKDQELHLTLGYSHPVIYKIPKGLTIQVEKQTEVVITGADKELVGQSAADIRGFRRPEPYHGKGVRYKDERIITKVGKSSGKK